MSLSDFNYADENGQWPLATLWFNLISQVNLKI
jgi:hypothetical protein